MKEALEPLRGKLVTKPFLVLSAFAAVGLFFVAKRFLFGLGSVTNLNDGYPWGIWIAYDVVVGTALACGGYVMALVVYILNRGEFHSALRPALLASMLGYSLAGISVIFDIGRYWHAYHLFLPQFAHVHSVLFEIALCISLYSVVLWIEFSPTFLEKVKARGQLKNLNRVLFIFIALGVLLPTMHQSSLGTLIMVAGNKVSHLWHSSLLPLLFLISAIMMGFGIVIFEAIVASAAFHRPLEIKMLSKLSGFIPPLLVLYLLARLGDLGFRGEFEHAFEPGLSAFVFWLENILYGVSLVLLLNKKYRAQPQKLFIAASFLLLAGAGYRFNSFLVGFNPGGGYKYFPSFSEMMITLGIISAEIMAYLYFVKRFPVMPKVRPAT